MSSHADTIRDALERIHYLAHAPEYELSDALDEIDSLALAAVRVEEA
jgi:hypothetical protein